MMKVRTVAPTLLTLVLLFTAAEAQDAVSKPGAAGVLATPSRWSPGDRWIVELDEESRQSIKLKDRSLPERFLGRRVAIELHAGPDASGLSALTARIDSGTIVEGKRPRSFGHLSLRLTGRPGGGWKIEPISPKSLGRPLASDVRGLLGAGPPRALGPGLLPERLGEKAWKIDPNSILGAGEEAPADFEGQGRVIKKDGSGRVHFRIEVRYSPQRFKPYRFAPGARYELIVWGWVQPGLPLRPASIETKLRLEGHFKIDGLAGEPLEAELRLSQRRRFRRHRID